MSINKINIWELAEKWLDGSLPTLEKEQISTRLNSDAAFAAEFNEAINLIQSATESGKQKRFRAMLKDIHQQETVAKPEKKAKIYLFSPQMWRTAGVAATVAIMTSTITFWSLKPTINKTESKYNTISREVTGLKIEQAKQLQKQLKLEQDLVDKTKKTNKPSSDVKKTGTGFALTNNGYFVTAYHVIHDENGYGDSVYIQNSEGQYYKASLVTFDAAADVAIMKVDKPGFRFGKGDLPYTFPKTKAGLGTHIYTMGYPTDEIMYSEGYIASRNGFEGDKLQYTLELPAGHGQSGSPLMDSKGNVLGLLTAIGAASEEKTYAVSTNAIVALLHKLPERNLKLPKYAKIAYMSREQQIEKMEDYTIAVKVYKK